MRRTLYIIAVAALATASHGARGQGSLDQVVGSVFDAHIKTCGAALKDLQSFSSQLSQTVPAGHYAITTTPDGQIYRISISSEQGKLNTQMSRYVIGAVGHESCATYYTNYQNGLTADVLASAYKSAAFSRVPRDGLKGGRLPQMYSGAPSDVLEAEPNSYEFLVQVLPNIAGVMTVSNVTNGYFSLVSVRDITTQ